MCNSPFTPAEHAIMYAALVDQRNRATADGRIWSDHQTNAQARIKLANLIQGGAA